MSGSLSRAQEKAIFANSGQRISSATTRVNYATSNLPENNPHALKRLIKGFEEQKNKAIIKSEENKRLKNAREASIQKDKALREKTIKEQDIIIQKEIDLKHQLKAGTISKPEFDEKVSKLRASSPIGRLVLPTDDASKKRQLEQERYFETIRSPSPIFPGGAEYKRYNPKTRSFGSNLSVAEQERLGVENPVIELPFGTEGGSVFVQAERPYKQPETKKPTIQEQQKQRDIPVQSSDSLENLSPSQKLSLALAEAK